MKKLIISLMLFIFTTNIALAGCDWNTGITPGPNHTFIYSDACHLAVGKLVQDNKAQLAQIADLTKAISLKDLAISNADARIALWQGTAEKEQDRLNTLSSEQGHDHLLYFGLGVLTVIGSGFLAARLIGH